MRRSDSWAAKAAPYGTKPMRAHMPVHDAAHDDREKHGPTQNFRMPPQYRLIAPVTVNVTVNRTQGGSDDACFLRRSATGDRGFY